MRLLPKDANVSAGVDVAFLGLIALIVVGFARGVAVRDGTPRLLRFPSDRGTTVSRTVTPEMGLLQPAETTSGVLFSTPANDPMWAILTIAAASLVILGPLWHWFLRPDSPAT